MQTGNRGDGAAGADHLHVAAVDGVDDAVTLGKGEGPPGFARDQVEIALRQFQTLAGTFLPE